MTALISLGKAKPPRFTKAVFAASRHYTAVRRFRFILTFALLEDCLQIIIMVRHLRARPSVSVSFFLA